MMMPQKIYVVFYYEQIQINVWIQLVVNCV